MYDFNDPDDTDFACEQAIRAASLARTFALCLTDTVQSAALLYGEDEARPHYALVLAAWERARSLSALALTARVEAAERRPAAGSA